MEKILDDMKIELGITQTYQTASTINIYDKENKEILGSITINTSNLELREKVLNLLKLLEG